MRTITDDIKFRKSVTDTFSMIQSDKQRINIEKFILIDGEHCILISKTMRN